MQEEYLTENENRCTMISILPGGTAVTLMQNVVNRWSDMGQPDEPLAEVILSVGLDLHVRAMGPSSASQYLRDLADNIERESN